MRYKRLDKFRTKYFDEDSRPDPRTLRRWIDKGDLPGMKFGKDYFVDVANLRSVEAKNDDLEVDSLVAKALKAG